MTFRADRLTTFRKAAGLTQYQLADKLGISQNQISSYERSNSTPTVETLGNMATLFNTTADYLLGLTNVPHPGAEPDPHPDLTPDEIHLLTLYRNADPDFRKRLLRAIEALCED